jgi:hypothetical protein
MVVVLPLVSMLVGGVGWHSLSAAPATKGKKADKTRPPIVFPEDPETVVLSYDPGAGGFIRKGEAPYLKIQADGAVTVTNMVDGSKKESKLTPEELEELVRFVIEEKDFCNITETKIADEIKAAAGNGPFIAIGGAGTAVISVEANDQKHEVSYRGAAAYSEAYPKAKVLGKFVAVEKRLSDFAESVVKGKAKGKVKGKSKRTAK